MDARYGATLGTLSWESFQAGDLGRSGWVRVGLYEQTSSSPGSLPLGSPLPCPLCLQLPHMPHISECLMKRSLKPTDLRDMTIGQLQVIVNDLHSQIESKWGICLEVGVR